MFGYRRTLFKILTIGLIMGGWGNPSNKLLGGTCNFMPFGNIIGLVVEQIG